MDDAFNIQQLYRNTFGDIVAGFSFFEFEDRIFYIKHPSEEDLWLMNREESTFRKEGISKKIKTKSEKLKLLQESDNWTEKEEQEYQRLISKIKENEIRSQKIFLKSQKADLTRETEKTKIKFQELDKERSELLGMTLERYIEKKKNEESLRRTLYKEKELINLIFSREEYEEMDDDQFVKLIGSYNFFMLKFDEGSLKKIAACSFFLNAFFLAKDSVFEFYGKRVLDLTFFQQYLFSKGTSYKNALSQSEKGIPDEIHEDLDKMVHWFESLTPGSAAANIGKIKESNSGKSNAIALVGATREELEQVAAAQGAKIINMKEEVRKMKKEVGKDELDTNDIIKMHKRLGI